LKADHLAVLDLTMPFSKYPTEGALDALWERLAPPLRAVPGVTAVSPTVIYPLIGPNFFLAVWETDTPTLDDVARGPLIAWDGIGPDYFGALGVPMLRGRAFLDTDRAHSQPVAIVSSTVARRYWPGQDPIGKRIKMQDTAFDKGFRTVVGVVGDTHWRSLREATPLIYLPYQQSMWQGSVVLRSASSLAAVLPGLRQAVRDVDPSTVIWSAHTMDDYLAKPLAQPRMSALLLSTFGLVALALAAIGLYAIMASAVREQTRDIGVRMALGATPQRVRGEVLRSAVLVSLAGAGTGIIVALAASSLIASLLFEVSPTDPVTLASACGVLLAVAMIAAYLPAHRASRVDPARAINE
jgi:putative ABC transport system permease protein